MVNYKLNKSKVVSAMADIGTTNAYFVCFRMFGRFLVEKDLGGNTDLLTLFIYFGDTTAINLHLSSRFYADATEILASPHENSAKEISKIIIAVKTRKDDIAATIPFEAEPTVQEAIIAFLRLCDGEPTASIWNHVSGQNIANADAASVLLDCGFKPADPYIRDA